jgi:site-specific DNA-methyltransferase (adenine-specific)
MNKIIQGDCMQEFKKLNNDSIGLTLTDIPYGAVSRESNGLRNLDKKEADKETFILDEFLEQTHRVTAGTIIIFCGKEQFSEIFKYFTKQAGTTRQIVWQKSNPSPMNGQYVYLSGTENAIWFKKKQGKFNAHCKNTIFKYPNGRAKIHPTEKNHGLLKELIEDNSDPQDLILDPCCGSGSHLLIAKQTGRQYLGIEISKEYCEIAKKRLNLLKKHN